ncbi:IL-1 receptor-like protein [Eptesipox virus]|uniref:IL-1 receptor-like protein n=1 Tax=Eptesipox virus TaxID=1329402 RepID=A0A220T661_9POXV|nr:IL-1 receptor-like protein [Eptesipox virus]YP_009408139.1 IL-1 receptor-like protein [Eptesipox virus]ASK51205.1 IL-1 receptor-like protein [Eptesipox virus]ASK51389.1 IL-1 receptor-like protein [Eptesipox virus]WAH70963.1 IL-1 receptor-like protein [Eptesipox virus]WAH71147.1 IL-1 receptor-like protein [Eptesipox virus]
MEVKMFMLIVCVVITKVSSNDLFQTCQTQSSLVFSSYLQEEELYAIKCNANNNDIITWAKAGNYYSLFDWKHVVQTYTTTKKDNIYVDNNNLWFDKIKISDAAVYVCFVKKTDGQCSYQATVIPDVDHKNSPYYETIIKLENDNVNYTQQLDILSFPNVMHTTTWTFNNKPLNSTNDTQLIINSVQKSNDGIYTCNVTVTKNNNNYTSIRNTLLVVKNKTAPGAMFINKFNNVTKVKLNSVKMLFCEVDTKEDLYYSQYKFYWKVNNTSLETTHHISNFHQQSSFPVSDTTMMLPLKVYVTNQINNYNVSCWFETTDYNKTISQTTQLFVEK